MSPNYTKLADLSDEFNKCTICVRVIRSWNSVNLRTNTLFSRDMLLLDEQGDCIHAQIPERVLHKLDKLFVDGQIVTVQYFKVRPASATHRPVSAEKKILFLLNTSVQRLQAEARVPPIPSTYFDFADMSLIHTREGIHTTLTDVIGKLDHAGPKRHVIANGVDTIVSDITLKLYGGATINLTVWGQLNDLLDPTTVELLEHPLIVAAASVTVNSFQGNPTLKTTTSSHLYVNPNISETSALQKRFQSDTAVQFTVTSPAQPTVDGPDASTNRTSLSHILSIEWSPEFKPDPTLLQRLTNRLLVEETRYNKSALEQEYRTLEAMLNADQRKVHDAVLQSVHTKAGKTFFVYGYGGTGKTFLWKTLLSQVRSTGCIALAVASSGIAALLLPGGRTADSRFHIPLDITPQSTCSIKRGTQLAILLQQTSLIIWDEASMANNLNIEAVDKSLRDILGQIDPANTEKPFGGITTVFGGDIRQTLPVIKKGTREDTVNSSLKMSSIWQICHVFNLTHSMRLDNPNVSEAERNDIAEFSNWILQIGTGTSADQSGEEWIEIPRDLLLEVTPNPIEAIIQSTYPNLQENLSNTKYLTERAILTPCNETVEEINSSVMTTLPGEEHVYLSADTVATNDYQKEENDMLYPVEFMNSLYIPGIPNHRLCLKVGIPVMLLRNLNQSLGLCNGTRLIVSRLGKWSVEARIMTGSKTGEKVILPRICLTSPDKKWPFTLKRRQYPLAVCFAMTINKSQGQSLDSVGLYLPKQVFTHGQLYVAVSRITRRQGLKILNADPEAPSPHTVKNIVYKEII